MTAWLLSIVGVVFLGVLVDIIAPNGKTNTVIKCVFGIFVLVVMATPIIKLLDKNWTLDINTQSDWLEDFKENKLSTLEQEIENHLVSKGITCVVEIEGEFVTNCINITCVKIYISQSVLNQMDEHINKYKHITCLVKEIVEVDEEIVIYEVI